MNGCGEGSLFLGSPWDLCTLLTRGLPRGLCSARELKTGGRTGQLCLGATPFPVISASWVLDGIYSAAVWTSQQVHLFFHFYWTVLLSKVGVGTNCSVVRCCRYVLIWCIDNHSPALLWKLLSPGSGLIQCVWIWGMSMNLTNMHRKDLYRNQV